MMTDYGGGAEKEEKVVVCRTRESREGSPSSVERRRGVPTSSSEQIRGSNREHCKHCSRVRERRSAWSTMRRSVWPREKAASRQPSSAA